MARKIDKQKPAAEKASAAEQLAVHDPNVSLTIAGRAITVREYGFFEGLRMAARGEAFIDGLQQLVEQNGELRFERIRHLFGVHEDAVIEMAAASATVEPEWVRGLNKNNIDNFLATWFGVNGGFFAHEALLGMRETRRRAAMILLGQTSSSASPQPASGITNHSASAPSGN